jgi:cell wall-associated NlpC family hydrolase
LSLIFGEVKKLLIITTILFLFFACKKTHPIINVANSTSSSSLIEKYAEKLNVPQSKLTNVDLYKFIDDWYGTQYKYGGLSKQGVDCSGFCNMLYVEVYKKQLPRSTKDISKQVNKVPKEKLQEGHLLLFNISGKNNSHVGVYLQNDYFVHASTSKGVIISHLDNPYYKKAFSKGGGV